MYRCTYKNVGIGISLSWLIYIFIDPDIRLKRERERESEDEWEPEVPAGDHWGFELVSGVIGLYCDLQQGPY